MASHPRPPLALIAALDENGVIGYQGGVPWRLPDDMRWFRQMTMGKPVIMGRKTYESIGGPLRGRHNIVVTRQRDYPAPGCDIASSPAGALALAAAARPSEIMVIGGAELYRALLPQATRLYLTFVEGSFPGDTYFPPFARDEWIVESETAHSADERHSTPFRFVVLARQSQPAPWPPVGSTPRARNYAGREAAEEE
jgi:dihydrofolate reductase